MMGAPVAPAPQPVQQQQQQQQPSLVAPPPPLGMKRPEDAVQYITVSDPVQHQEGMQKYTSYRVDVRPPNTPSPQMNWTPSAVLRRYSDFLWLYDQLHLERPGSIVPAVPEKQPVGRFSPQFVEDRRIKLQGFLRQCAVHPEVADAPALQTFLQADDLTFAATKKQHVPPPTAASSSSSMMMNGSVMMGGGAPTPPKKPAFKRWFAEAKTSIAGDLIKSPDDELFEEIARYVHGLDGQMKQVAQQASAMVKKGKEISNGLFEFGLAFTVLGQSESDALGAALQKLGETADKLSVYAAEHAETEGVQFEAPLQDLIKTIHGVKLALQKRHEHRLTYSTAVHSVEAKNAQLAKLRAQVGMEAKAYGVEMSLRRSQETAQATYQDFCAVSQRVLREVDRFKRETAQDMRWIVLNFIQLQVEFNKRMEEVWGALIPQLEQVQIEPAPAPTAAPPPVAPPQQPAIYAQPMVPNASAAAANGAQNPYYGGMNNNNPADLNVQYRQAPPDAY